MESPRRNRNRAACKRCQRRKIRCDGNEPSCSSCLKAGASCVNDGKQEVTRRYISNMENRIRWLESIVKENCANVDLSLEPRMIAAENAADHDSTILSADLQHEDDPTTSSQRIPPRELRREAQGASRNEGNGSNSLPDQHPPHHMTGSNAEHQPAHEIGLVSLSSGEGPRYIGPSSGYFFANRIFSSAGRRCKARSVKKATAESTILSTELLSNLTLLPTRKESAVELSKKYFRTVHLIYPFLHEPTHMSVIDRVYTSQNENPLDLFQVYMVLSISALNLSRECKVHLPVEGYYASAMKYVEQVCSYGSVTALQCMLLLMVYAPISAMPSLTRPDEETGADCASQGHKLDMAVFEATLSNFVSFIEKVARDHLMQGTRLQIAGCHAGLGVRM
nr:hypothetical protein ANI_1_470044 [Aspergillus niger CBS 513.88]|eukprot:XP_001390711.2 hypothetical protein ANI_1_470044 [Aspergillus niger CBS 513.88]